MIAYISPLIPKRTGIALYSHHLIKALQIELMDSDESITVFDNDVIASNACQQAYHAQEILPLIFESSLRQQYRQFIFHFGNNPFFHLPMLRLLQKQKGIVVLHDTILYFLITGQGTGGLWRSLAQQKHGDNSLETLLSIFADCPQQTLLNYPYPEKHPLLQEVLSQATTVVVHSKLAEQYIREANYSQAIYRVPLIDYQQLSSADVNTLENTSLKHLMQNKAVEGIFFIGLLGFGGNTKRSQVIFRALADLSATIKSRVKLIIIGTDSYRDDYLALGLSDMVICTGYVSDSDYDQGLAMCDLIINLRYPSMGETSAVQIQAMSAQKASIVSNHGWFSELPDKAVYKITVGDSEQAELSQGIVKTLHDKTFRLNMAYQAKAYVTQFHSPQVVAQQWLALLAKT